jgi:hypothetical protein
MTPNPTNTVSLLTNTFFCDTLPSQPQSPVKQIEASSTQFPLNRELLDMPNVIPDTDGADEYFGWDDVSG